MKRRFLAVLLTVMMVSTMFAGLTAGADAEVVKSFIDTDMDNDTSWNPGGCTYIDDTMLNTKVAKYEVPVGTDFFYTRCRNEHTQSYASLSSTGVLWGEISIKYEGAFTRFAWEHDQASPPVWIDDDGSVRTGGYNVHKRPADAAGTDTGYDLELGKWYHIVSALDYTANTNGAITIWINGEKIINAATPNSRLQGSKGFVYVDLKLVHGAETASTVYLDNYRSYITAAIDSHPENSAVSDENSSDGIGLVAGYITGAENATVTTVKGALTNGDKLAFVKDGTVLGAEENVLGAEVYAPYANGKGFRTYEIATETTQIITKKYVDMNFDNWTNSTHGIDVNNVKIIADNQWAGEKTQHSVATVPEKNGSVLKFPIGTSGGNYYVRARVMSGSLPSTYADCDVLWTEYSIKYEGGFVGFGFGEGNNAYNLAFINKSGNIEVGTRWGYGEVGGTSFNRGTSVPGSQLEVGKWYHIVVAADFTDEAASSGVPTYIWINGELVGNGIKNTNITPSQQWVYHKLYFDVAEAEGRTAYIDNLKVYESATLDNHAATDFDVDVTFDDSLVTLGEQIQVSATATVTDVKELIAADNYTFVKDGAALEDNDLAVGSSLYVKADNAIGFKYYSLVDEIVYPPINVMREGLNTITASIRTRNEHYHPVSAMADGSKTGDSMYKSHKIDAEKDGLKVVASLDAVYEISSVIFTERYMDDQDLTVTVEIGKNGSLTKVVDSQPVTQGSGGSAVETTYDFDATEGDTIVYTFIAGTHREDRFNDNGSNVAESDYQIYEIEAFGTYVEEVEGTGFVPEIDFWYYDWDNTIISYYINCCNAGDEEITGKFFIAAYEDDELVKLTTVKDVTISKGVNTISCTETASLYNANWTYKAFLWDSMDNAKPLFVSQEITK
ncbi:MAG: hypothetical protein E7394_07070 [Ruminococcaceae bacterium]|nr:hypothetical protein [Oscillospiraceae bacterium]